MIVSISKMEKPASFFSAEQVAKKLGISRVYAIRLGEMAGVIPKRSEGPRGFRLYSEEELALIESMRTAKHWRS